MRLCSRKHGGVAGIACVVIGIAHNLLCFPLSYFYVFWLELLVIHGCLVFERGICFVNLTLVCVQLAFSFSFFVSFSAWPQFGFRNGGGCEWFELGDFYFLFWVWRGFDSILISSLVVHSWLGICVYSVFYVLMFLVSFLIERIRQLDV